MHHPSLIIDFQSPSGKGICVAGWGEGEANKGFRQESSISKARKLDFDHKISNLKSDLLGLRVLNMRSTRLRVGIWDFFWAFFLLKGTI